MLPLLWPKHWAAFQHILCLPVFCFWLHCRSCVLNFNNITGPAVIVLPLLFQQAGWLVPTVGMLVMWVCSSFAATMLTESMQRIPGNHEFQHRYEYSTLVRHYFGDRWYLLAQVGGPSRAAHLTI